MTNKSMKLAEEIWEKMPEILEPNLCFNSLSIVITNLMNALGEDHKNITKAFLTLNTFQLSILENLQTRGWK